MANDFLTQRAAEQRKKLAAQKKSGTIHVIDSQGYSNVPLKNPQPLPMAPQKKAPTYSGRLSGHGMNLGTEEYKASYSKLYDSPSEQRAAARTSAIGHNIVGGLASAFETGQQRAKDYSANLNNMDKIAPYRDKVGELSSKRAKLLTVARTQGKENAEKFLGYKLSEIESQLSEAKGVLDANVTNTPVDQNKYGQRMLEVAANKQAEAKQGLGKVAGFLSDATVSIGSSVPGIATSVIAPAVGLPVLGAQAAGQKSHELSKRGIGSKEAWSRGVSSGLIEIGTEAVPIAKLVKLAKGTGGKQFIKGILEQSGTEATEESIAYTANFLADKAAKDPEASFSLNEIAQAAAMGAISGGVLGGTASLGNRVATGQLPRLPYAKNVAKAEAASTQKVNESRLPNMGTKEPAANKSELTTQGGLSDGIGSLPYANVLRKNTRQQGKTAIITEESNMNRYKSEIDGAFTGSTPIGQDIVLGKTPDILIQHDVPDLSVHMAQGVARKIAYPNGYLGGKHNLGLSALKNLPYQLENPIAILRNPQPNTKGLDSKILITEWNDVDGKRVVIPIHLNAQGALELQHDIASTFGADYIKRLLGNQNENVIYTKNNEDINQLLSHGRRLPEAMADDVFINTTIPPTKSGVNHQSAPEFGENTVGSAQSAYPRKAEVSKVRTNTIENSPMFTAVEREILKPSDYMYDVVSEKQSVSEAKHRLQNDFEGEVADLPEKGDFSGEDLDTSMGILEQYLAEARKTGDYTKVSRWSKMVQDKGTQGGQLIQSFAKYTRTPEGAVVKAHQVVASVEREIKKNAPKIFDEVSETARNISDMIKNGEFTELDIKKALGKIKSTKEKKLTLQEITEAVNSGKSSQAEIEEIIKSKFGVPTITNEDTKNILGYMTEAQNHAEGSYDRKTWEARAEQIIADKVPAEFREKFRGAQRLSMLLNPKTLLTRNPLGNVILGTAENAKDVPGTLIDKIVGIKTGDRTTSASLKGLAAQGRGFKQGLEEWGKDIKNSVDTSPSRGQMELPNKRIFDNNLLNTLDQFERRALMLGDRPFYQAAYNGRMEELKRLGEFGEDAEVKARLFALDRVFQNNSKLAEKAGNIRREMGIFGDLIMPFTQTPANVMDKLLDYSPVGLGKALVQYGQSTKSGVFDQKLFVDRLSRSMTGLGIIMLGGTLAAKGLATGDLDKDKDVRAAQYDSGKNPFSFKIGDGYYSFDWAQPIGGLLSVGANAYLESKKKDSFMASVLAGAEAGANTVFKQQFLQGVFNLFSGYNPVGGIAKSLVSSTSQATPSGLAAVTKTIDPYMRETYDPNAIVQQGKKLAARLPGLSATLPQKLDAFGKPVMQSQGRGMAARAFENFLSPGKFTTLQKKVVYDELTRLYNETGSASVFPNTASKNFRFNDETVTLSAKDYETFAKTQGDIVSKNLEPLLTSNAYKNMADDEKADAVSKLYEYAGAVAKSSVSRYVVPDNFQKVKAAESKGVKPSQYFLAYAAQKDVEGDKDANGDTIDGTEKVNKRKAIDAVSGGLSGEKKMLLYDSLNVGLSKKQAKGYETLKSKGMSQSDFMKYLDITNNSKGLKNQKTGKTISGSLKNAQYKNLIDAGLSPAQAKHFMSVTLGSVW